MSEITTTDPQAGTLKALVNSDQMRKQFALALPSVGLTPERFSRVATTALLRNPNLAKCDQPSFMKCLLELAQMGLEPNGRDAHLIPRNKKIKGERGRPDQWVTECTFIVDYKGLIGLIRRSGEITSIKAVPVHEEDEFVENWNEVIVHRVDRRKPRGKLFAVYSMVTYKDGSRDFEIMSIEEINAVRDRSKSGQDGPWVTDFVEMAKKTVIRRHSKTLPIAFDAIDAMDKMDREEFGDRREVRIAGVASNATAAAPPLPLATAQPISEISQSEPEPSPADQAAIDADGEADELETTDVEVEEPESAPTPVAAPTPEPAKPAAPVKTKAKSKTDAPAPAAAVVTEPEPEPEHTNATANTQPEPQSAGTSQGAESPGDSGEDDEFPGFLS
jgi:recombination protein RecT